MYVAIAYFAVYLLSFFAHSDPPQFSYLVRAPRALWVITGMRLSRQRVDLAGMIVQVSALFLAAVATSHHLGILPLSYGSRLLVEAVVWLPAAVGILWAISVKEKRKDRV